MYGMVNRALETMVVEKFGAARWTKIKEVAGIDLPTFASLTSYDDALTINLLQAASHEFNRSVADLLREFGRYWIEFALDSSYGPMLKQSGNSLREILPMLDRMHARIALSFPQLSPPSFHVLSDDGDAIRLRYESKRVGLAPFVHGLLEGLGTMYGTPVDVSYGEPGPNNEVIFRLTYVSVAEP